MTASSLAAMRSLAVAYPREIRTNDYFREKYPEVVESAERRSLAKIWAPPPDEAARVDAFDAEMAPFLNDPFRGASRRRVLSGEENALSLEVAAARGALAAAKLEPGDVDLVIVGSFLPDT